MEMLASKLNPFGSFSKTSKASVSKPSYTYEQPNSSNKENVVDSIRKEKNQPRTEENTYQSRARSLERRNLSNTQPSFNYNRTESSSSQTLAAQFGNFFNSPKNIEGDFFKNHTQDKDSYRAKHLSRGLKSSFTKQDEKTSQSASSDHYLQSKIDQIINSSLSIKERSSKNTASSSKNINSSNNFEEKSSEKLTLYTRLLNDMRTATPKSKDHANQDQHYGSSASKTNSLASSEYYKGSDQAKKPYLDLKLSSVDFETNIPVNAATSTNAKLKEEVKNLRSSQRLSFSQKRSEKSEENIKPERAEQQQKESVKKGDYPKQERLSLSRTLTVNTQSNTVEPHIPKYPVTMKNNSRGGLRYNDNQSIYESLTNLKRSLERPLSNSIKNNSLNGPSENNLSNVESKETKAIYKSSTPKANTASSSEVKNILQSFRNVLQRENKHQAGDEKQNTSINKRTLDDETYQNYLKEGAQRAEEKEKANLGSSMSSQQRPPSASKSSKYRESSLNLNRRSEDKLSISNSSQNYEKEKPQQKSLKDFITQVNPADNIIASKTKMDIQKPEPQNYSNIQVQPQSAKNNTRPLLNERHMAAPGATINISKTSSTTTNSSVAQESRSFTFNSSLINKHSSRTGGNNNTIEERNNAMVAKKEAQKAAAVICQYYMAGIEKYLKNTSASFEGDYFAKIYREHFLQGYQAINFCKYLKPVDPTVLAQKKVYLPKKESHKDKKTIIFDLDETLIHCNENANIPSDVVLPIRFPHGDIIEAGINVRPYAIEALEELSKHFEIVVFTASHSCYANVVLDYLDPQNKYIHHRLFRESCVTTEEGLYVKDLRIFANRNLKDMVIVDNAMYSFGYQFENGIPIIPFYYHKNDKELKTLVPYLKSLYHVRDVREVNIRSFKLHSFCDHDNHEDLLKKLFE